MKQRMHNDLPPASMGRAVIAHASFVARDPKRALEHFRTCRELLDHFVEMFHIESGAATSLAHSDKRLIGELFGAMYWAVATANRLDRVIAELHREVK